MKALRYERDLRRFGAARVAGSLRPGSGATFGPLELVDIDPPQPPGDAWVRLRPRLAGICGSDLSTIDATSSRWFEPIVSFPFVPGHEIVAATDDDRRVVVEPVLGCVARGISPVCGACADGRLGNCEHLAHGDLSPGLQSGYCCDTGGGWSTEMVAHPSQLHDVPDDMSDRAAVMIEPTACAVHAALSAEVQADDVVAVIGAGTLGLLSIAALDRWSRPATLLVAAKHPHQRTLAKELSGGSAIGCDPDELVRAVRRATGTKALDSSDPRRMRLTGGADVVFDCVGSADSLLQALSITRPRGRIIMVGMPGELRVDLTPLWQREITLAGAYAYGTEHLPGTDERRRTFDLAADLVAAADLGRLVSAVYPLDRFSEAIVHAANAGRRGAVKVAFDLQERPTKRNRT